MVTNLLSAQIFQPVYNPIIFAYDSTKKNEEGFNFILNIFPSGSTTSLAQLIVPANPDGYGVFDIHKVLESQINPTVKTSVTGLTSDTSYRFNYYVQAGEEYLFNWGFSSNFQSGSTVGFSSTTQHYYSVGDRILVTQQTGATNSSYDGVHVITAIPNNYSIVIDETYGVATTGQTGTTIYSDNRKTQFLNQVGTNGLTAIQAAFSHEQYRTFLYTDYQAATGATSIYFTNLPQDYTFRSQSNCVLKLFNATATTVEKIQVRTYSDDNYSTVEGVFTIPRVGWDRFMSVGVGCWNLNNTSGTTVNTGSLPIIKSSTQSFTISVINTLSAATMESRRFQVNQECSKYPEYQIVFMDRKGSWVPFVFELASTTKIASEKKEYKKITGSFNGSTWGYNSYDRGRTVFNSEETESVQVISNWVTESVSSYIRELITTCEAYVVEDGNVWRPIIIKDTNYEPKQRVKDKIFNITMTFEYAQKNEIPRG